MTIKETDQTASPLDPEPATQPEPDILIYQAPDPGPGADPEAVGPSNDVQLEADVENLDDVDTRAESYDRSDFQTRPDETETNDEPELEAVVDDAASEKESDIEAPSDGVLELDRATEMFGPPEPNGDGQAETEDHPERESEAIQRRPSLTDLGIVEERWNAIRISFVDDPRQAVQDADLLLSEAIDDLGKILLRHRQSLQAQWQSDDVDTEQLRLAFQRYRAFHVELLNS